MYGIILFVLIFSMLISLISIIRQVYKNETSVFPKFRKNLKKGDIVSIGQHVKGIYITPDSSDLESVIVSVKKGALYPCNNKEQKQK